jgi:hypothetical protein
LLAEGRGPKTFQTGDERFVRQVDLRIWLDAASNSGARPRVNIQSARRVKIESARAGQRFNDCKSTQRSLFGYKMQRTLLHVNVERQ